MNKNKRPTKRKKIEQPYEAVVRFLEKNGWNVVVIGGCRIRQRGLKYNFSIEFDFAGSNPNQKPHDPLH